MSTNTISQVAKFGGTSVGDARCIQRVLGIVNEAPGVRLVVLSASGDTTDHLVDLYDAALTGAAVKAARAYERIYEHHTKAAQDLGLSLKDFAELNDRLAELLSVSSQIRRKHPDPALRDRLLGFGEALSCFLFSRFAKQKGRHTAWLDARELLPTDSRYGQARPDREGLKARVEAKLRPLIAAGVLVVTQGFVGADSEGRPTTLGRGGSDFSASLYAEALGVDEVHIWTDVPGVYTTDPREVDSVLPIPHLSYAEAEALAAAGGKVIHPHTVFPARAQGIPIWVGSSLIPGAPGTWIRAAGPKADAQVRALASQDYPVLWIGEWPEAKATECAEKLIARLEEKGGEVLYRSERRVVLAFAERLKFNRDESRWLRACGEWREHLNVRAISLIGQHLDANAGLQARLPELLDGFGVLASVHDEPALAWRVFVPRDQALGLLRHLHRELLENQGLTAHKPAETAACSA
ncbi:MAG: aspartate kinase [Gammaproteobacteria bacterium]|nr:aspartate kinase [Gammaproteobacteria bacterium]